MRIARCLGDESDQRFSLIEHQTSAKALAAPLQRDTNEDEYSFVVDGRMGALLGQHRSSTTTG